MFPSFPVDMPLPSREVRCHHAKELCQILASGNDLDARAMHACLMFLVEFISATPTAVSLNERADAVLDAAYNKSQN